MRWLVLIPALLLVACATSHTNTLRTHVDRSDKPIVDTKNHVRITVEQAAQQWRQSRHVYVGEQHATAAYHRIQLAVLKNATRHHPSVAIGIEWLPRDVQSTIDEWLDDQLDTERFLEKVDWKRRWGFPFEAYEALFRWAKEHRIPIIALNAPTGLARRFGRVGPCGLSPTEQHAMPPLNTGNEDHRRYFQALMGRVHHHGGHHGGHNFTLKNPCPNEVNDKMERYYLAQTLRDEAMSQRVAEVLTDPQHPKRLLVVFAGVGHVEYGLGIPQRAQTLTQLPYHVVLPHRTGDVSVLNPAPRPRADFLWEIPDSAP